MDADTAMTQDVAAAFERMPQPTRDSALRLRGLILGVAQDDALAVQETLKWGEPAYLPGRAGTTVRIGWDKASGASKMLVHCQTTLIDGWRDRFGGQLTYEGNRAVVLPLADPWDEAALRLCVAEAFSYHRRRG